MSRTRALRGVSIPRQILAFLGRLIRHEGTDPLLCPTCRGPMELVRVVFGPHEPIADLFRLAGKTLAPRHPIWDTG